MTSESLEADTDKRASARADEIIDRLGLEHSTHPIIAHVVKEAILHDRLCTSSSSPKRSSLETDFSMAMDALKSLIFPCAANAPKEIIEIASRDAGKVYWDIMSRRVKESGT